MSRWLPKNITRSLSTKVLALTIIFILIAEIVVLIPSIAKERGDLLKKRFDAAYLVTAAMEAPDDNPLGQKTAEQLFATAGILGVTVNVDQTRSLILAPAINPHGGKQIIQSDAHSTSFMAMILDSWGTVFSKGDHLLQVSGAPQVAPEMGIDIIVSERTLRNELRTHSINIFWLSLFISTLAGALVFAALNVLIIKPVLNLTDDMVLFEKNPETIGLIHKPSDRKDELGDAEQSLANMQTRLQELLMESQRLAALGSGISKITHDLRNILASAQLMSDRLAKSDDPRVQKLSPRLISALDRAIALSRDTLTYGGMDASKINKSTIKLAPLIEEVFDNAATLGINMHSPVDDDFSIDADRTQIYRCLFNLVKNAAEAIVPPSDNDDADIDGVTEEITRGEISIDSFHIDETTHIEITDTGPGLPDYARENVFEPFKGSKKPGGSGLGMAISAEIIRAHGGEICVKRSDETGTVFSIEVPRAQEIPVQILAE